jgi:hypothetical protein
MFCGGGGIVVQDIEKTGGEKRSSKLCEILSNILQLYSLGLKCATSDCAKIIDVLLAMMAWNPLILIAVVFPTTDMMLTVESVNVF